MLTPQILEKNGWVHLVGPLWERKINLKRKGCELLTLVDADGEWLIAASKGQGDAVQSVVLRPVDTIEQVNELVRFLES
jgi:hypothetical protein